MAEIDPGSTGEGSSRALPAETSQGATDPLREALARTWWGARPWHRYVRLLVLIGPALVVERVAAVTDFSRENAWPVLVALDLGNWLQIVTGSFMAWFPWSLAYVTTVVATVATWAAVQTVYATAMVQLERQQPVMVATYGHVGLVAATLGVPFGATFLLMTSLPGFLFILPAIGIAGAWFVVSESLPDQYRMAKIDLVNRRLSEGRATYDEVFLALVAGFHMRFPRRWRQSLASLLILVALVGAGLALWRVLTDRTPWVPQECIVYAANEQPSKFKGYLLIEGNQTDLVLRASDRVVLSLPAALVSRSSAC